MEPIYDAADNAVSLVLPYAEGCQVVFKATEIRKERTGIHAKLHLGLNTMILAYSTFNVGRDEDRARLVNSAYSMMGSAAQELVTKATVKHECDLFCLHLWPFYMAAQVEEATIPTDEPQAVEQILEPYIIKGGGTILFAPPGAGKSYTAKLMAVSIDAGVNYLWPVKQRKVGYINLERSAESIRWRLHSVNLALGLDPMRPLIVLNKRGRTLNDLYELAEATIKKHRVEIIFLDSISRTGLGDMKEDAPVNKTIDLLNSLPVQSWVALAHTPRQDQTHLFGSIMFEAGADIIVQLLSQPKENVLGIGLQVTKANDSAKVPMAIYAYEFDSYGLQRARHATGKEFLQIAAQKRMDVVDEIEDYLLDQGTSSATDIAKALGRNRPWVSNILNADGRFNKLRQGRKVLFGVGYKDGDSV